LAFLAAASISSWVTLSRPKAMLALTWNRCPLVEKTGHVLAQEGTTAHQKRSHGKDHQGHFPAVHMTYGIFTPIPSWIISTSLQTNSNPDKESASPMLWVVAREKKEWKKENWLGEAHPSRWDHTSTSPDEKGSGGRAFWFERLPLGGEKQQRDVGGRKASPSKKKQLHLIFSRRQSSLQQDKGKISQQRGRRRRKKKKKEEEEGRRRRRKKKKKEEEEKEGAKKKPYQCDLNQRKITSRQLNWIRENPCLFKWWEVESGRSKKQQQKQEAKVDQLKRKWSLIKIKLNSKRNYKSHNVMTFNMDSVFLQESWHILFSMGGEGSKILNFQFNYSFIYFSFSKAIRKSLLPSCKSIGQ